MPVAKITPLELGCARPYALSAKGMLLVAEADRPVVRGFVDAYSKSARALLELLMGWWQAGGDWQAAAGLLVCPASVPLPVVESSLWKRATAAATQAVPAQVRPVKPGKEPAPVAPEAAWVEFADGRLYQFLRAIAGVEGRVGAGSKMILQLLGAAQFPRDLLSAEAFAAIFDVFPSERLRSELAVQVAGILKSYFSQVENARLENVARTATQARLRAERPAFFAELERVLKSEAAWQRAARSLRSVRTHLLDEKQVPMAVVNACQLQATLERPDFQSWQPVSPPSPAVLAVAQANRPHVDALLAGFPASVAPDGIEEDIVRRLSSGNRVRKLDRDPRMAGLLLSLYDRHVAPFDAKDRAELFAVTKFGRKSVHTGWQVLMKAKGKQPRAAVKGFFAKEVVAFAESLRMVRTPVLSVARVDVWPLFAEGDGWSLTARQPGGVGNAVSVELSLPAYLDFPVYKVAATIRGNIAFSKAEALAAPLDVKDGLSQFRPNQTVGVEGDPGRKTYLKPQALRLTMDGSQFFAVVSTKRMTETPRTLPAAIDGVRQFEDGERVGVFHLRPGGMRLGTLTVFERQGSKWRDVPIFDDVTRTDPAAYQTKTGGRLALKTGKFQRIQNTGLSKWARLHFETNALCLAFDAQMSKIPAETAGGTRIEVNRAAIAATAPVKTDLGEAWLKSVASRIGQILARNKVGRLVVAGTGPIESRGGFSVPVKRFFSLMAVGPHKNPSGLLTFAAQKAGVAIYAIGGRYAQVDSKGYTQGQGVESLALGVPYRFLVNGDKGFKPGEKKRTRMGAPSHLFVPSAPNRLVDFDRNGAESILLAVVDERFKKAADALLEGGDARGIELPV